MLGARLLPDPIPLDWLGATGCTLFVDVATGISATFRLPGRRPELGVARIDLQLPGGPAFLGAR